MNSNTITAISTGLLAIFGLIQLWIFFAQKQQSQLNLTEEYRKNWSNIKDYFGVVVFFGRNENEFYQVADARSIYKYRLLRKIDQFKGPTIWALDPSRQIFSILSDITTKILQNQIRVSDIYPFLGDNILRQSRPLRILLDNAYPAPWRGREDMPSEKHIHIRKEIQTWLIYHDGIRRRCLILIDILWAEAARLEDLPPDDVISAADSKVKSGKKNRKRLFKECIRLSKFRFFHAYMLSRFLKKSEYKKHFYSIGLSKKRLETLEIDWTIRLLKDIGNDL